MQVQTAAPQASASSTSGWRWVSIGALMWWSAACAEQAMPPAQPMPEAGNGADAPEDPAPAGDPVIDDVGASVGASSDASVVGPDDLGPPPAMTGLGRPSIGDTPLPCELDRVLATSCRGCHGAEPGAQSPMALVTYEDLMAQSVSDPSVPVYRMAAERVHSETAPMPPTGRGRPLIDTELAVLDGWLEQGTPSGEQACDRERPQVTTDTITFEPPSEDEIDQCYGFYAHQNPVPGDAEPFVAGTGEFYAAFYFDVPWEGEKQGLLFRSSDSPITHHWLLYDTPEPLPDGTVLVPTTGTHPGAPDLLAAWAINQQGEQYVPKEAGLALPIRGSGRRFLLEVHYFNSRGAPMPDRSGVEVCTGKALRPNTATVSWLGTEAIALLPGASADITGTCTPQYQGDIYIYRSFPHMHEQGYHLTTRILRSDGMLETLVDEPFDFNNQIVYDTPAVIRPGDQLLTTCRYNNRSDRLIGVGYDSLSEMCFNFVYAWPAKALIGGISLTGTSTPCLL